MAVRYTNYRTLLKLRFYIAPNLLGYSWGPLFWDTVFPTTHGSILALLSNVVEHKIVYTEYVIYVTSHNIMTAVVWYIIIYCCANFCFENRRWDFLRWCHNGWPSNILSDGCQCSCYLPQLKCWMPIHYDTIEDGQNKKCLLLFSFLGRIVLYWHFIGRICLSKILLHLFIGIIWMITPLMKINVWVQETKIIAMRSSR